MTLLSRMQLIEENKKLRTQARRLERQNDAYKKFIANLEEAVLERFRSANGVLNDMRTLKRQLKKQS